MQMGAVLASLSGATSTQTSLYCTVETLLMDILISAGVSIKIEVASSFE